MVIIIAIIIKDTILLIVGGVIEIQTAITKDCQ